MPSAIWTGTIGFGLVTVPVKAVSATKSQDVRFNQLEEGTGARIRYRKVSERPGDEVPNERIVKGYEVSARAVRRRRRRRDEGDWRRRRAARSRSRTSSTSTRSTRSSSSSPTT